MKAIYFEGEDSHETEQRLIDDLIGFRVSLRTPRGYSDVVIEGIDGQGRFTYRIVDRRTDNAEQHVSAIPWEDVQNITVY